MADVGGSEWGYALEEAIKRRRSVRKFLPTPVPNNLINEALALAQLAPSDSNSQPWRLFLTTGAVRDRLSGEMVVAAKEAMRDGTFNSLTPSLPPVLKPRSFEFGSIVYGAVGVRRDDVPARQREVIRNFEFYGAPMVGAVCVHRDTGPAGALAVGAWLQTLMLALTARGLGSIAQVSLTSFPALMRSALRIPDEFTIICGLSIGYPDWTFPGNQVNVPRVPLEDSVTFIND